MSTKNVIKVKSETDQSANNVNSECEILSMSKMENKCRRESVEIEKAPGSMPSVFYEDSVRRSSNCGLFAFQSNSSFSRRLTLLVIVLNLTIIISTLVNIYIYRK